MLAVHPLVVFVAAPAAAAALAVSRFVVVGWLAARLMMLILMGLCSAL